MAIGNAIGIGIPMVNLGLGGGGAPVDERFIISVKTDNTGTSNDDQFTLPWIGSYDVEWGDGLTSYAQTDTTTHTYATAGTYDVSVTPTNNCRIFFNNGGDRQKLLDVKNWGTGVWTTFSGAFLGCSLMDVTATDTPDLSIVTTISNMFRNCLIMVGNSSFENWDTSNINNISGAFRAAKLFNQNISSWDTSNFNSLSNTFFDADSFNQPIGVWDTSNMTTFNNTFRSNLSTFDQSLANWDITSLTTGTNMFNASALGTANYDATLIGWAAQSITNAVTIDFGFSQYTLGGAAETARNTLVSTYGWTITDGGGI